MDSSNVPRLTKRYGAVALLCIAAPLYAQETGPAIADTSTYIWIGAVIVIVFIIGAIVAASGWKPSKPAISLLPQQPGTNYGTADFAVSTFSRN